MKISSDRIGLKKILPFQVQMLYLLTVDPETVRRKEYLWCQDRYFNCCL